MDLNHDDNIDALAADIAAAAESAPVRRRASRRVIAKAGELPEAQLQPSSATEATEPMQADAPATEGDKPASQQRSARTRKERVLSDAAAELASESTENASVDTETSEAPARKRSSRSRTSGAQAKAAQAADSSDESSNEEAAPEIGEAAEKQESNSRDGQRNSRTRQRERKRRGQNEDGEPEIAEDDVLLPIAGILDVLDNYAFVRTSGYLPGPSDVYVSLGQVKKYGLRKGDAVVGAIRQPREGEGNGRQKYNAIVKVDAVNQRPSEDQPTRTEFADLTPVHPTERIRLETEANQFGTRVIDLFAPIGKGQRALIAGPHESGKSALLQQVARAVAANQPDAHLMLVLIDERPEVVTELERTINGEVIASTFDRPADDHTTIAELAVARAQRLVELGHDVVVLIDSLTDLARAYNLAAPASLRVAAGNLDAASVFAVKRLLSAARNIENGGSLTIVATASAQPGSQLDDALLAELEAVANMQLRLDGAAADRRMYPAVNVLRSSTRNEELLTSEAETKVMSELRRSLQEVSPIESLSRVLDQLGRTSSNVEFLAVNQRQLAGA